MIYVLICIGVLALAYLVNITYISVFYHRGFTHSAIRLRPWLRKFVIHSSSWVTGIDLKSWSCMHRLHHLYSDTRKDPHSPVFHGIFKLIYTQYKSYSQTTKNLMNGTKEYTQLVRDLNFPVHWVNRAGVWWLPYAVHTVIALLIVAIFGYWLLGICYYLGMMSHPIQGWLINSFGHYVGYRNFGTNDNSRNNPILSWFILGEGYQNNHHQSPKSANFGVKWYEFDPGFLICRVARALRLIEWNTSPV